ncbi:MAG: response regulator [Planctomycetes bacterium]|nr:response regulator [Planctomycetota bacterium]
MSEPNATSTAGPLVLVVDDELHVRRFLKTGLSSHAYRVLEATTGDEGIRLAKQYVPDLVLLDLGLPDVDGLDVMRAIREWSAVPVIVLSARGQEGQKVAALDAGADDYLTKPFGFPELLARIRAALRRAVRVEGDPASTTFSCGPLRVDLALRRVLLDDEEVHLTPIEYKLLTTLVQHAGKVVTQKQLLEAVWGPESVDQSHYLRVYMTHLRRKLEPDPARPRFFATEAGVGYRLQCPEA